MEIRVRELLEFLRRNPRLEEYDAPICVELPKSVIDRPENHVAFDVAGLDLDHGKRLTLCVGVTTAAKFCDGCAEGRAVQLGTVAGLAALAQENMKKARGGMPAFYAEVEANLAAIKKAVDLKE